MIITIGEDSIHYIHMGKKKKKSRKNKAKTRQKNRNRLNKKGRRKSLKITQRDLLQVLNTNKEIPESEVNQDKKSISNKEITEPKMDVIKLPKSKPKNTVIELDAESYKELLKNNQSPPKLTEVPNRIRIRIRKFYKRTLERIKILYVKLRKPNLTGRILGRLGLLKQSFIRKIAGLKNKGIDRLVRSKINIQNFFIAIKSMDRYKALHYSKQILGHFRQKRYAFLATLSFFLIITVGIIYSSIISSKPGDMLFFPRTILERTVWSSDIPEEEFENLYNNTSHRFESLSELLSDESCVQSTLAQSESIESLDSLIIFSLKNDASFLLDIEELVRMQIVNPVFKDNVCNIGFPLELYQDILSIMIEVREENNDPLSKDFLSTKQNDLVELIKLNYSNALNLLENNPNLFDQDEINRINGILQQINSINLDESSFNETIIVKELSIFLEDEENEGFQQHVYLACSVIFNENCNDFVASQLNSALFTNDSFERLRLENSILVGILSLPIL